MSSARSARRRSAMAHMALALWLNHDARKCWQFVYTSYYDASGFGKDAQGGVLLITGLLATEDTWLQFEPAWDAMLDRYGVKYLHMKEYVSSQKVYAGWEKKLHKRGAFLARASHIMKAAQLRAFSAAFLLRDYQRIGPLYRALPTAYHLCAAAVLSSVVLWMKTNKPGEAYQHVVARGDDGQGPLRKEIEDNFYPQFGPITARWWKDPATGDYLRPVEAADYYAWEQRRLLNDFLSGFRVHPRKSLRALDGIPDSGMFLWRKDLVDLCDMLGLPRRS